MYKKIEYNIISSGSHGNCVIVNDIMIDCGISIKLFNETVTLKDINHVFFTHRHGDHIKKSTLKKLRTKQIYLNAETYGAFKELFEFKEKGKPYFTHPPRIIDDEQIFFLNENCKVRIFEVDHDVQTHGFLFDFTLENGEMKRLIYSTDNADIERLPKIKEVSKRLDYVLIEANYDYKKIMKIYNTSPLLKARVRENLNRHCSKQDAEKYFSENSKPTGVYEPLHKSSQYYK